MPILIAGKNDLKTLYPEIAKEADGWDPSKFLPGSDKKLNWICKKGHNWKTSPKKRSKRGDNCPYCSNRKAWTGFNDLQTAFPEIAKEADGWDPSLTVSSGDIKRNWKCQKGHLWQARMRSRTRDGTGCPYCANKKVLKGFNDLQTAFPEIAKEADGWDPSKFLPGSGKKLSWKCERNHIWNTTINSRTSNKRGCPYCANQKVLKGFNDLQTAFPEIAKEANGWDPSIVIPGSRKKFPWICEKGHTWNTAIGDRTLKKSGCPICSNRLLLSGFNDLQTAFPEIAKEADGWDPNKIIKCSGEKLSWKCEKGHTWISQVSIRTYENTGCPYCSNHKLWKGFNDLKTLFPEVAKEANGWDPSTLLAGTEKKMSWKCEKGHIWFASLKSRTRSSQWSNGTGCPECAVSGFKASKPAWFYLMARPGEQQIGITNDLSHRFSYHGARGWYEIDSTGPHSGYLVVETENAIKKWLRKEIGLIPGTHENWYTSRMEVNSLAELKKISGIVTSIF